MEQLIQDTSWVWEFIHNLFSGDSKNAEQYMAEKMPYMNRLFYKYCSVCEESKRTEDTIEYNIQNFENDELFFQSPALFNDPFDCYMGISQNETIKNLIITAMRQQDRLTPGMRKTINALFAGSASLKATLDEKDLESLIPIAMPYIFAEVTSNTEEQEYVKEILAELSLEANLPLFIKLLQNKATVADQQAIVDIVYKHPKFKEYMKKNISNPDYIDWILKAGQQDAKIKIERNPNALFANDNASAPQSIDMLHVILNSILGQSKSSDLGRIMEKFEQFNKDALEKTRQLISQQCRVTCLSECMDSSLMWSHYANKHFGFCLEYDFTYNSKAIIYKYPDIQTAEIMLLPVIYTDKRPSLSKSITSPRVMLDLMRTKKMPAEVIEKIIYGMLHKSKDWSYEREWRIISVGMKKPTMKLPPPRKLFLGANIEQSTKERLVGIAKEKQIPVYQMCLSPDRYQFEYYKVE